MSINVTVHGNPISINKGKMVTCDADSEFHRRRLIRLQQVRQQSKEIAADVRNRVRKEKERLVSKTEQKGEQDLRRWKQKKLLALQHQYEDCLKDVGTAHDVAALEPDPHIVLCERAKKNLTEANLRGKKAQDKQVRDGKEKRKESEKLKETRDRNRQIENERSLMVAALNRSKRKKKKKRKKSAVKQSGANNDDLNATDMFISDEENISDNIIKNKAETSKPNISIEIGSPGSEKIFDSTAYDSSFGLPSSPSILNDSFVKSPSKNKSILSTNKTPTAEEREDFYPSKQPIDGNKKYSKQSDCIHKIKSFENETDFEEFDVPLSPRRARCGCPLTQSRTSDKKYSRKSTEMPCDYDQLDLPLSPERSRYSRQRARSKTCDRRKTSEMVQDSDDSFDMNECSSKQGRRTDSNIHKNIDTRTCSNIRRDTDTRQDCRKPSKSVFHIESYKICDIPSGKEQKTPYLPFVPPTTVQPEPEPVPSESQVKYYDRINHFGKEYTAKPVIQRINKGSIKVNPSTEKTDNEEAMRVMQCRDKLAHERGVRAMEKEKIQKDYKQLMEELPLLQRQEQMAQMRTHNSAFHMDEDRLKELEKRKQNKIENIFEKYYNKSKVLETPLVAIRPIQKSPPADEMKLPFRALDVTESPVQLNVAEWKNETTETDQNIQEDIHNKQKALVDLLQRVNKQRELLLKEVSTLPATSNLQNILHDDEILKLCLCHEDIEKKTIKVRKPKIKLMVSTGTSPVSIKSPSKVSNYYEKRRSAAVSPSSDNSSSELSTHKRSKKHKLKHKKQKILIRNECTQTSPNIVKPSSPKITTSEETKMSDISKISKKQSSVKSINLGQCTICCNKCICPKKLEKESAGKLCEIVIQMNDKSNLKICESEEESDAKKVILNVSKPTKISIRSPRNANDMSSSTTYNSLPEYQRRTKQSAQVSQQECPLNVPKPVLRSSRQQFKEMLHDKPQQTNIDSKCKCKNINAPQSLPSKKEITPNLLRYIQKLLSMSRQSIDELTISSISETSTPGNSVVDNVENNTLAQLQNVMQYYNLSFNDIQKHLSVSESSKTSVENSTTHISSQNIKQKQPVHFTDVADEQKMISPGNSSDERKSPKSSLKKRLPSKDTTDRKYSPKDTADNKDSGKDCSEMKCSPKCETPKSSPQSSSPPKIEKPQSQQSSPAKSPNDSSRLKINETKDIPYTNILSKYKELTETCCDRISKLTEMIDNVRLEKERLLSPENSDKYETSVTSYLDLPKMFDSTRVESNSTKTGCHSNSSSTSTSSLSQDAIDRYLLAIDKISYKESPPNAQNIANCYCGDDNNETDEIPVSDNPNHRNTNQEQFVPMLQGIPKYVEPSENQTSNFLNSPVKQFLLNSKSKPPPALLRNVNKYNLDIDMTPHELSTIVELDTIISSRNVSEIAITKQRSPEKKLRNRVEQIQEDSITEKEASGFVTLSPEYFKTSPKDQNKDCPCKPDYLSEASMSAQERKSSLKKHHSRSPSQERPQRADVSGVAPLPSELSTSPEDMELILRNMGLGWAVSTLRKTHEALALSSSSSSVETSFRKRVSFKHSSSSSSNSNSNTDVSLKNILSKELIRKISSSTLVSNSSGMSPNLQELEDISEIRDPTVLNRDGSQHRTSTPVQNSKSTDSKKELFTGDSDISSVRLQSEEFFLSIPNVSLSSTNKSLSKSKH